MGGIVKQQGWFGITPHKVSVCILIQVNSSPGQFFLPDPFSSVSEHNCFGMFLLSLIKSHVDIVEPKLSELVSQLSEIGRLLHEHLTDDLTNRLSSLSTPDDLFNFFSELRGVLGGPGSSVLEDDQISLDPSSNLGMFLRGCLLSFNSLSFEGVCHLLLDIQSYCKEAFESSLSLPRLHDFNNESEAVLGSGNMDLENYIREEVIDEVETGMKSGKGVPFHLHVPKVIDELIEGFDVATDPTLRRSTEGSEASSSVFSLFHAFDRFNASSGVFLRSNWQTQGYLLEQANLIEKQSSLFPLNPFETLLRHLQKLAPDLHLIHFLRYLNLLYHYDYTGALENLHRYFDYSAGMGGIDAVSSSSQGNYYGSYEIALLCLGMMHFHFGHPKLALEVLTEAVRACQQQSNDSCLAYTLAVICSLLSEFGITSATGIFGSTYSPMTSMGTSLTIQQQLFVLLRRSSNRAESLKLTPVVAANHLAMAKFDMTHVQRPLLSFGPKASISVRTRPADVCKEVQLSSHMICDFGVEGSVISGDSIFGTGWLRSLQDTYSSILTHENGSRSNGNAFQFCAQRSSMPRSVLLFLGSSYLFRATVWEIYGSCSLAQINALVYATCFADASSLDNLAVACVKLVQHIVMYKGYKEAFSAFRIVEEKFRGVSELRISLLKLQLLHEFALHRGNLKLAQQVCDELGVMASSVTGVDMELKIEASLRHARTLLAAKQFGQAAQVALSLFCTCYKFNMQIENASVLLLLAEIHKKSGDAVLGLPYVLASLSFCQSFNLDLLKASATITMSELWLSLGPTEAKRALALLYRAFPMILGCGGLELRARAHITEAKCYLSDPSHSVLDEPEVVLDPLKEACEELRDLEYHELAAEAYYLLAIVYNKLGKLEEREAAATSFKKHITSLEDPQDSENCTLHMLRVE